MSDRTRDGFYTLWTIAILICLGFCVFLLIYTSIAKAPETAQTDAPAESGVLTDQSAPQQDTSVAADAQEQQPDGGQTVSVDVPAGPTVLGETMDLGQEYLSKIVFLGDSTTYGLYTYGLLPHSQVWVPASGTLTLSNYAIETIEYYPDAAATTGEPLSIVDAVKAGQPEYLVITLGLNGIAFMEESTFKEYYVSLVNAIQQASPGTRIICNSIFPVIDSMTSDGINNSSINAANQWIQSVAEQTGTRYLNSHDVLLDDTGNLRSEYTSGDGMHLLPDGYNQILQCVRTHGYQ